MKLMEYIKKLIRNYFVVFSVIVMSITVLRQIFAPGEYFELKDIYIYMLCSLISVLPGLIFYSPRELSEKEMRIRIVIHFTVLEAVLLIWANGIGVVNDILHTFILAIEIAVIYVIVRFILWIEDTRSANSINKKLRAMKDEYEE